MKMRLDKYLSDFTELTRSQAKKAIREGRVSVNEEISSRGDCKIAAEDRVKLDGQVIKAQRYQYIMLNKPAGLVSATCDDRHETVVEYIKGAADGRTSFFAKNLFPMGRLDKDTEGLLIITNDGEMAHRLLSPKNHVAKKYFVRLDKEIDKTDVEKMSDGIDIGEKHRTKPAKLEILSPEECYLTITEGKFHQIKRMFAELGKKVIYLKRIEMGGLGLDDCLEPGEWRFLTAEEIKRLKGE